MKMILFSMKKILLFFSMNKNSDEICLIQNTLGTLKKE
jgi:hypothetical protein